MSALAQTGLKAMSALTPLLDEQRTSRGLPLAKANL
jgi:hypothetical protein